MSDAAPNTVEFPSPTPTALSKHYWTALDEGRLDFQRCTCGHAWLPPRSECPKCLGPDWTWQTASGRAKLVSWVVYHHGYHPYYAAKLPYNVAVVELAEGPRMISNVVGDMAKFKLDLPLTLKIEREAGQPLARFALA